MNPLEMLCVSSIAAALGGCAIGDHEVRAPAGHPANPQAAAAPHERSTTLVHFDPVNPRPARSERWADPEHPPHHEDNVRPEPEPEPLPEPEPHDPHHRHDHPHDH